MNIKVPNLFRHADGGYYCLLSNDAPLKSPHSGNWHDGVIYMATDGKMRSTVKARWEERFEPVAELNTDDSEIISMIQRCNPGSDFDLGDVFSAWHESEMAITGQMLELAVAATALRLSGLNLDLPGVTVKFQITTEDLQRVSQNYEIERVPEANGYSFIVSKSFPNEG